jgi:hypothetical protein
MPIISEAIALPLVSPAEAWTPTDMRTPPALAPQLPQKVAPAAIGWPQFVQ